MPNVKQGFNYVYKIHASYVWKDNNRSWRLRHFLVPFHSQQEMCSCFTLLISLLNLALCSRNFQNVKIRLDFVETWWFFCHSDFMWNPILVNSNGPKVSFLSILKTPNFEFLVILGLESCSNLLKSKFRTSKIAKNDNFGPFECTKMWFHEKSEWQ